MDKEGEMGPLVCDLAGVLGEDSSPSDSLCAVDSCSLVDLHHSNLGGGSRVSRWSAVFVCRAPTEFHTVVTVRADGPLTGGSAGYGHLIFLD